MSKDRGSRRRDTATAASSADTYRVWLLRAMEALWLLTVGLVPLTFAPPDFMLFIDVPKVALLRTMVGLMAMLWVTEWAIQPQLASIPSFHDLRSRSKRWISEHPSRSVLAAATLFLVAYSVSTLLSPALSVSLWGNNPGRDGYGLYNMASYYMLFLVIATHLKTKEKLWRLLSVVVIAATIAALYGVLQHLGLDPLDQRSGQRVHVTFGNPLFAASFLAVAFPISLGIGFAHSHIIGKPYLSNLRSLWTSVACVVLISVQLVAVLFTLSRGPWLGLATGLLVWLVLLWGVAGRRMLLRGSLFLGAVFFLTTIAVVVIGPPRGLERSVESGEVGFFEAQSVDAFIGRTASIGADVTTGGLSGRLSIWGRSVSLVVERPWLDPEEHRFLPLRYLFGYGPEMFLYALPLRWASDSQDPLNASAHNYLLHLTVELGVVGAAAYIGLIVALLIGGGASLWRGRDSMSTAYQLTYAALMAALVVRSVEQMAGVARISDFALFWTIAAALAAMPSVTQLNSAATTSEAMASKSRSRSVHGGGGWLGHPALRLSIALLVVIAGVAFIWQKNINYTQAAALGSDAVNAFRQEDLLTSLELMDRAIVLAPDFQFYRTGRAQLMNSFATGDASDELEIATEQYILYREALKSNPLSHSTKLAAAISAMKLLDFGQEDKGLEAIQHLEELVRMLPGYERVYQDLASAYLIMGQPRQALDALDGYLSFTGGGAEPELVTQYLRGGVAHHELGML